MGLKLDDDRDFDELFELCFAFEDEFDAGEVLKLLQEKGGELTVRRYRFSEQSLQRLYGRVEPASSIPEVDEIEEGYDIYEASAFHGFLLPGRKITEEFIKATDLFLNRKEVTPGDERTIYFQGDTSKYDISTAFIQAIELTVQPSTNALETDFLQLFLNAGVLRSLLFSFNSATKIFMPDEYNATLGYMQTWHCLLRKGYVEGLRLCFENGMDNKTNGVFMEAVSVTSMTLDGFIHTDFCAKALHLACRFGDNDIACELAELLIENGADVNSVSMRTEDEDEELESDTSDYEDEVDSDEDAEEKTSGGEEEDNEYEYEVETEEENSDDDDETTTETEDEYYDVEMPFQNKISVAELRIVETPLHIAIKRKNVKLMDLLVKNGADVKLPMINCPLDKFPYSSMNEVLTKDFNLKSFTPKWLLQNSRRTAKGMVDNSALKYTYDFETKYRDFIKNPFDVRALITVDELVDFYAEDENMKAQMSSSLYL